MNSILSQLNPFCTLNTYLSNIYFNIIPSSMPRSPSLSLPFTLSSQYAHVITQTFTCPTHFILGDLISQITLSEDYIYTSITYLLLPFLFLLPLPYIQILSTINHFKKLSTCFLPFLFLLPLPYVQILSITNHFKKLSTCSSLTVRASNKITFKTIIFYHNLNKQYANAWTMLLCHTYIICSRD